MGKLAWYSWCKYTWLDRLYGTRCVSEFDQYNMNNTRANQRRIARLQRLQTPKPMNRPQNQYDTVYFDFPVQSGPGGQELQAAENLAAIYTRDHPEDNHRSYDVGLFAKWTRQK